MHIAVRRIHIVLEMVSRNALSLGMLLSPSSSRIEKVVHALECATTLPRNFSATFVGQRILQLNI